MAERGIGAAQNDSRPVLASHIRKASWQLQRNFDLPVCFRKLELGEALRSNAESYWPRLNEKCEIRSSGFRAVSYTELMSCSFSFSSKHILIVCSKEMTSLKYLFSFLLHWKRPQVSAFSI